MDAVDEGAAILISSAGNVGQRRQWESRFTKIVDRDLDPPLPSLGRSADFVMKSVLVTKAIFVTSIMKRVGKPVASIALANGCMIRDWPGLLGCDVHVMVVLGPKVSLIRSIDWRSRQHQMGQFVDQAQFGGKLLRCWGP